MEIVIEETLVVGFFLNYLILKITSKICARQGRFIIFSSLLGSVLSLMLPLWRLSGILKVLVLVFSLMLINLFVFKYKSIKDYLLSLATMAFSTFLFGGGCYALNQMVGSYPTFLVVAIGGGIYVIACVLIKSIRQIMRIKKFTYKLVFKDGDKVVSEEGYLDSGNVLYDAITKKPIVLVNFDVFHKFYENVSFFTAFTRKIDEKTIKNGHYMKINSVGRGTSMLIFTVDELSVEGDERRYKNVLLGLSFSGFEKSFGKNVLLHCDYS